MSRVPAVLRHVRRINSQLRAAQRRQRATLAATVEDLKPNLVAEAPAPQPAITASLKTYEELPMPRGYPLLGTLPEFLAAGGVQRYHEYVSQRHQELGGIFRERTLGGPELVFVSDPVAVRQVFAAEGPFPRHYIPEAWLLYNRDRQASRGLFFMDGEEWKEHRRVLNIRLLRPSTVASHQDAFSQVADALVRRWTSGSPGRPVPDLEADLYRWSIESLGVMVFGNRLGFLSEDSRNSDSSSRSQEDMERFIKAIHGIFQETCAMGTFPPALAKALRLKVWSRFADVVDRALDAGQQLVEEGLKESRAKQERGEAPSTLLDCLLQEDHLEDHIIIRLLTDLFIGAADTTSHTAIWSLYLLGTHPQEADRARREVLAATGGSRQVRGEHLTSLPYLKGVVKEALRMYPVAPFQTRVLARDSPLAGHLVPAGTMVVLSVCTTGRDPIHFPNPHQFRPERWLRDVPETSSAPSDGCPFANTSSSATKTSISPPDSLSNNGRLHSHAFIPFGVGSRSCIGRRVAETELYLLLAKLVASSDIRALNQVEMVMRMVGVTSEPLQLRIDPLSDGV